ncbi:MAG: hypothetical protein ABSH22_00840 [Tepidisphaeraceae bacterium]|jgi:hypothetical protein
MRNKPLVIFWAYFAAAAFLLNALLHVATFVCLDAMHAIPALDPVRLALAQFTVVSLVPATGMLAGVVARHCGRKIASTMGIAASAIFWTVFSKRKWVFCLLFIYLVSIMIVSFGPTMSFQGTIKDVMARYGITSSSEVPKSSLREFIQFGGYTMRLMTAMAMMFSGYGAAVLFELNRIHNRRAVRPPK